MSSLSPKDRVSLCMFAYADGRRCRTPRISTHPHFCYDHAQKESRVATADKLANDLAAFFSGHYISANDLSTALARLLPAVVRGDIKPRTARTVAYMAQTLLQSIHHAQSEFQDSFGPDNYRKSIRSGITSNHTRLFPPDPVPDATLESFAAKSASDQPAVVDGRGGACPALAPDAPSPQSASVHPQVHPPVCHPERSEGPLPVPAAAPNNQPPAPVRPQPPAAQPQPTTPPPANPKRRPDSPHRDPYAIHFDHTHRLLEPEKAY
ncbi:MAG TPA: hypothetical protein VKH15_03835 [Candidatus Acidoferrum sp.]|nr:hypothetical protein [Candidatus Acidoferrum sp.]